MSDLTSKKRPVFVPAVRTPKLPYLCAGAECVTCKRPVSGDWGLVPDECDTCDAERRARYYRECAQWADDEIDRLTREVAMWSQVWDNVKVDNPDLRADNKPLAVAATYALLTARNAELVKALERLAQRRDRHHDCGDYERGYGDAEASASAIARAALKEPTLDTVTEDGSKVWVHHEPN